jgi:mannose-6-phosphate isomerase-like protein (cupin superfamily)
LDADMLTKPCIKKYQPNKEYFFTEGCFINEISNSADDPGLSIARARLEPGKTTKWHILSGVIERYVILEGSARVEVGDLDPQQVSVGDVVIIPSQVRQRIRNTGKSDLVFLAICSPRFEESVYTGV